MDDDEPLLPRAAVEKVAAAILDLRDDVRRIRILLEEDDDEEPEGPDS